jgi:peptidoglycan/xylan/chitin deacetylase (PgdA/CDA1 family)
MDPAVAPVRRRQLLVLGAVTLLAGCAHPPATWWKALPGRSELPGDSHPGPPGPGPSPSRSPWQPARPATPTPGVCPGVPGIVQHPGGPQHYVPCRGTDIALTVDDGPDPEWTPRILALLARYRIPATFCMVGRHAVQYPQLVAAVAGAGHQIANHTFTHPQPFRLQTPVQVRDEIARTSAALTAANSGHPPTLFRAPGGEWSPDILAACAAAQLRPLDWSVDPRDWSRPGVPHIVDTILTHTRPGSIILEHDGGGNRQQTLDALTLALPRLLDAGYHFTQP